MRKYINNKNHKHECPICRNIFINTDIYYPIIENNTINNKYSSKITKLLKIIDEIDDKKIIIVTQYKYLINKINNILSENNIINYNLLNIVLNTSIKKKFNNINNKSILIITYDDILKLNFNYISSIIFLDYLEVNPFEMVKTKYFEKYLLDDIKIKFYMLYTKDTFEEKIIDSYKLLY